MQTSNLTDPSSTDVSSLTLLQFIMSYLPILINSGLPIDVYTFSIESMLIQCTYAESSCTAKDFTSFYSATYGRCYTFNAKTKNNTLLYSYSNSGLGVLSLRLYLYDHLYITYRSEGRRKVFTEFSCVIPVYFVYIYIGVAIMAMVHDNTQLPTIERAGMTLAPGFKHRLTYTKKSVYSLPPPYSSCTSDIPLSMKSMFDKYNGADYAYSEDICYIICQQTYVYTKCGCVSPAQWNVRSIILPGTSQVISVPLCNTTNPCFGPATIEFEVTSSIINEYCTACAQQCSITSFSVKSSIATTPPDWLIPVIKSFVENSSMPLPSDWNTEWQTHIKASYLSLDLLSESTLVENYTQTATMGFVDVLSNIGGQTGLWIGISFLSLMEFVEMIYRLIRYHFYLIRRAAQRKKIGLEPEKS